MPGTRGIVLRVRAALEGTGGMRLATILGFWFLLAAAGPVEAKDPTPCPEYFRIVLADGTATCLTEHPLAGDNVVGHFGADLRRLLPRNSTYAIAATPMRAQCKRSVGLATLETRPTTAAEPAAREEKALQDCRLGARGASEDCRCKVLALDGRSALTRTEFARYAGASSAGEAEAAAALVPTPVATPVATPTAAPVAAPAAISTAQTSAPASVGRGNEGSGGATDEIAALRQQMEALRAEVARARPAPAGPAATVAAPGRKPQRARALVIGNSRYVHLGALPNPGRDAEAIAAKLRGYGIEVDLALDTDRPGLVKALSAFQARATGYDVNLLFYAGHGLQVGGINYIVPVDMNPEGVTVGSIKLNGVSLDDALEYLPATTRVVFLDACRDNPISRSLRNTRSGAGVGLAPAATVSGTLLSYATRDGAVAEDGTGQNSPYTTALLKHLDAEDDIALVLRRVRQEVLRSTSQRQEPWEYGSLVGEQQLVISRLAR
jgi:hypothetical protein